MKDPDAMMEKTVTLNVSLELKRLLEAEGATVIMTRDRHYDTRHR